MLGYNEDLMTMKYLKKSSSDNLEFVHILDRIIVGSSSAYKPEIICIVKIDNWFGKNWLKFSHKALGAFGVASSNLVIPPFNPNRVVSEETIVLYKGEHYQDKIFERPIHISQRSEENPKRKINSLFPTTGFYWWCGNTDNNNQGCLMAYLPTEGAHYAWYLEFGFGGYWKLSNSFGITRAEVTSYE